MDVDRNKTVGGNEDAHIVGNRTHKVDKNEEITVQQDQTTHKSTELVVSWLA